MDAIGEFSRIIATYTQYSPRMLFYFSIFKLYFHVFVFVFVFVCVYGGGPIRQGWAFPSFVGPWVSHRDIDYVPLFLLDTGTVGFQLWRSWDMRPMFSLLMLHAFDETLCRCVKLLRNCRVSLKFQLRWDLCRCVNLLRNCRVSLKFQLRWDLCRCVKLLRNCRVSLKFHGQPRTLSSPSWQIAQ